MENRKCRVNLVGIGMGSKGTLTEEVRKIIAESDVLIGAMRMLEGFREKKKCCYAEYLPEKIRAILDEQEKKTRCTVLFSGDTGFYSGAKKLADILKKDADFSGNFLGNLSCGKGRKELGGCEDHQHAWKKSEFCLCSCKT